MGDRASKVITGHWNTEQSNSAVTAAGRRKRTTQGMDPHPRGNLQTND